MIYMKSRLYSELIRKKVDTPIQKGKSKLVEILATQGDGYWVASEVMIESGLVNRKGRFFPVSEVTYNSNENRFELDRSLNEGDLGPMDDSELHLSYLDGKKIKSHDGKELGRIYDFELYIDFAPWKVWKILMDPAKLSPLKRRIKIPTKAVDKIENKCLVLKKGWKGGGEE